MYNRTADNSIYLNEDRYKTPKELFKQAFSLLKLDIPSGSDNKSLVDIGGATGEFLYYVRSLRNDLQLQCIEYSDEMVNASKSFLNSHNITIEQGDANNLSGIKTGAYDFVTTLGVTSIFDDFRPSFNEMIRVAKPGGLCVNAMLVNEEPIDVLIKYLNKDNELESGWNKFSINSITEFLKSTEAVTDIQFIKHTMPFDIPMQSDPMRSYTKLNNKGERILWNGLNMEISIYFILFRKNL